LDDYYELLPDEWRDEVSGLHALVEQARWDPALAWMLRRGWPLRKAAYLVAATTPETPDFPLDLESRARIPEDLDGEVPESVEEYNRVPLSLPDPTPDDVN
jgi:hypothetical protein